MTTTATLTPNTDTQAADVYTVAPGYHVSFLAGAAGAVTPFDLIEVVAARPGGPAAQQHQGATWFHVLEGHLEIFEAQRGRVCPSIRLSPGETHTVPAGAAHAAHNAGEGTVRFLIGGQPGTIASYLAQVA
ncbi:MAG TPA: cupin domain-containing protein [Solirubrobacteraceae bacterium]|nr:cupin domain-containing protein [Solirubrobacteraceae bacterium]